MSMLRIELGAPESQSADLTVTNVVQLKALFPELVTEGPNGPAGHLDVLKLPEVSDASCSRSMRTAPPSWLR